MAKPKIPAALQMQRLKYADAPEAERDAVAELLRAEGRRSEAILLFEGRGDHRFLQEERDWATREGDAFLLLSIRRLGCPVDADQLRACAQAAEQRGRWMDARNAWLAAGDDEAVARVAEHLPPSLRPAAPPEADSDAG
jgi:hypothetical protein